MQIVVLMRNKLSKIKQFLLYLMYKEKGGRGVFRIQSNFYNEAFLRK